MTDQKGAVESRGGYPRANRSKSSCCVPLCGNTGYILEDGKKVTFHSFPKDAKAVRNWIVKIRRDVGSKFKLTSYTRICSRHFLDTDFRVTYGGRKFLKEGVVPSVFPWTKDIGTCGRRLLVREQNLQNTAEKITERGEQPNLENSPSESDECASTREARIAELEQQLEAERKKTELLQKEKAHVHQLLMDRPKENQLSFCLERFSNSDANVCFYTGFPTYNSLRLCLLYLNPGENGENIRYVYSETGSDDKKISKPKKLKIEDEFFLTLVRLRLGLFETDLAHRFSVSKSTVQRIFTSWVNFMYLRLGNMYIWPSQEAIRKTMPESMKEKYPTLEWIIDAFEIQCERPSSLVLQSQSYSNYKSRNTLKGLVACTPSGQLGFISQLYTGSISDREITIRSGFLRMPHNKGAVWLVDKGFQIQDLADPLGVKVNMPAFVGSRQQMSADEVFHTQQIASERIHIERVINKVKNFHIFNRPIPLSMSGSVNQMWTVCGLLTLWQRPIISA